MFKSRTAKHSYYYSKTLLTSTSTSLYNKSILQQNIRVFSSKQQQQRKSDNRFWSYLGLSSLLGLTLLSQQVQSQCEDKETEEQPNDYIRTPILKKLTESFEIPKLLLEREQEKLREYQQRESIDIKELEAEASPKEIKSMSNLDNLFWQSPPKQESQEQDEEEEDDAEDDEGDYIQDPYTMKKKLQMKHQEYRIIEVGAPDLLKNGQMIQVSVCDPFNDQVFHPTDKVIICKHTDQYYAMGSFCGFDYTNLATGVLLGEKLICPTCGSTYNILNGYVDQGPSMRNLSSFVMNQREEKVNMIIPEHVPAFAKKKFIKRALIDPRLFVILGDSETALSAIDALRSNFTGRIIIVPTSPYGSFENTDILTKKFSPINKNESYMVESDYLDRANVDVIRAEIAGIDVNKKQIKLKGQKDIIYYDKVLIAWGAEKKRLNHFNKKEYTNVYYIEDRQAHARVHNELLKANVIVIMGGSFEAYQSAASIREYLDSIGYTKTQIVLMDSQKSEVQSCFGSHVADQIHNMLKEMRISVIMNCKISSLKGINKLEAIHFTKDEPLRDGKQSKIEYFLKPDIVIAENGVGGPKCNLKQLLVNGSGDESSEVPIDLGIDLNGLPASDVRFSLHYNDISSTIFAAGSATQYPAFIQKVRLRTNDIKYNIEAGFYAAMNMLDKRVEFRYLPMTSLRVGDRQMYFVGERIQAFTEVIIDGSLEDKKYIAYYVYGNEVVGFVTCGYQNVHLYLLEAMKLLIMPPATQLRNKQTSYREIVRQVLQMRPMIECKRHEILKIPSVMAAEFEKELDDQLDMRIKLKKNIEGENRLQREKFMQLKEKYDREGVEYIGDEMGINKEKKQFRADRHDGANSGNIFNTRSGKGVKPGDRGGNQSGRQNDINMGVDNDNQKNPFSMIINNAKKHFNG